MRRGFLERSVGNLLRAADRSLFAEETARRRGLLQSIDPRAKVVGLAALIVAVTLSHRLAVIGGVFAFALLLAVASRIDAYGLLARVLGMALLFTAVVALPALVLTPGPAAVRLPLDLTVTATGLRTAAYLVARVGTATFLSLLLVLSTRWAELLRGLRALGMPLVLVVVLAMTYRYIFVLLQTATDLFDGRRSRRLGRLDAAGERRLATSTAGALLLRSMQLGDEIYLAMQARGFRGEVRVIDPPSMRWLDWLAMAFLLLVAAAAAVGGR